MIDRIASPIRRRKSDRPRELLSAALDLFIEKGFAAAKADEIAARAGVSKGTLYLYFEGKEDLLDGLIAQRFFCRFPFESEGSAEVRAGRDALRDVMGAWRSALIEGRAGGVVKLVFTEAHQFPDLAQFWVREVMAPSRARVATAIRRGVARAEFRAVDPDLVVNALLLPVIATCLHRHAIEPYVPCDRASEPLESIDRHVELVLEGLMDRRTARPIPGPAGRTPTARPGA